MVWSSEPEIIIDPFVLALVWSGFAPGELKQLREFEEEDPPTDSEEDQYIDETSRAVFGSDSNRYPLDFFKSVLLFTTKIRTLFSGRKSIAFREMLHDSVHSKYHKQLAHVRPLFDDAQYESFRRAPYLQSRPWDLALSGFNPADLDIGSQKHAFTMSTVNPMGQVVRQIFRFLNEDDSSDYLIEEVHQLRWSDGEPIDLSLGFHQFVVDYLALYRYSFDRPFFSFNDVSSWIVARTQAAHYSPDQRQQLEHAITVTMPNFGKLSLDQIFELREERFIKCYREIVQSGGIQKLSRDDVDRMLKAEILEAADRSAFGIKELTIDLAKLVLSLIPGSGLLIETAAKVTENANTVIELGEETGELRSRFRRFRNRWLWFVKNARNKTGDLFNSLADHPLPK